MKYNNIFEEILCKYIESFEENYCGKILSNLLEKKSYRKARFFKFSDNEANPFMFLKSLDNCFF